MADIIQTGGLRALRRDLRLMAPGALVEVRGALKEGATVVATAAGPKAPRRTGKLAGSYRAGTAGNKSFVRSRLPYAAVHEFGGVIRPKGAPITIRASRPIHAAFDDKADRVIDIIGDRLEGMAVKYGWR